MKYKNPASSFERLFKLHPPLTPPVKGREIKDIEPQGKPWPRFKRYHPVASYGVLKKNKSLEKAISDILRVYLPFI